MDLIKFYMTAIRSTNVQAINDTLANARRIGENCSTERAREFFLARQEYLINNAKMYNKTVFVEEFVGRCTADGGTCGRFYGLNVNDMRCHGRCEECIRTELEKLRFFDMEVQENNTLIIEDICDSLSELL